MFSGLKNRARMACVSGLAALALAGSALAGGTPTITPIEMDSIVMPIDVTSVVIAVATVGGAILVAVLGIAIAFKLARKLGTRLGRSV